MLPYFAFLTLWMIGTIQFFSERSNPYERLIFAFLVMLTAVFVGLRYEVGADWATYVELYQTIYFQPVAASLRITDPAYGLLNWLGGKLDWQIYLADAVCAFALLAGLGRFARDQRNPWLAMTVAFPYLIVVVGMGYTRQAAAIGILFWALATRRSSSTKSIILKTLLAASFHKTAILFLPILLAPIIRRNILLGVFGLLFFVGAAAVILRSSSDFYVANYIQGDYQSSGAAVRVTMNVLAAIIWFIFRKRFRVSSEEDLIWSCIGLLAFVCAVGLALIPSSVGIDRIALFLIPIQVFVLGNLPYKFDGGSRAIAASLVLSYSMSIQIVYFFYASYSYAWVPYQNILFASDWL